MTIDSDFCGIRKNAVVTPLIEVFRNPSREMRKTKENGTDIMFLDIVHRPVFI
jgi:hypothetical protein